MDAGPAQTGMSSSRPVPGFCKLSSSSQKRSLALHRATHAEAKVKPGEVPNSSYEIHFQGFKDKPQVLASLLPRKMSH